MNKYRSPYAARPKAVARAIDARTPALFLAAGSLLVCIGLILRALA